MTNKEKLEVLLKCLPESEFKIRLKFVIDDLIEEAKSKAVPEVTDAMALAFHRSLTDGSIGAGEIEEIKVGLRAAMLSAAQQSERKD